MTDTAALSSHNPLYFAEEPEAQIKMSRQSTSRLLYIANWKLESESARSEPQLRKLLGHISVYDQTRTFTQNQSAAQQSSKEGELSDYFSQTTPSFKAFQTAIQEQLNALAQGTATTSQTTVDEYESNEDEEDDSDYDSYDGEWSDADTATDSDGDGEQSLQEVLQCSSSTKCSGEDEDVKDLWAIRPPTRRISMHI